jgi:lactate permease
LESWSLFIAFTILLFGVFFIKKLWLGALGAILFLIISKAVLLKSIDFVYHPFLSGVVISIELGLLLFGAYLFYNTLHTNGHFSKFIEVTSSFSSRLFVIILLCIFMGSFMEGIAGFGIPAVLIAPLLITLGFKPLTSIVLPLAANTTAVTFGALGTPLKVGLGIYESDSTVIFTLFLNSLPALLLPFLLAYIFSKTEQIRPQWKENWKMLAVAGFSYVVPYIFTGLFSIEYPSVVAGIIGLLLFIVLFLPKNEKPSYGFWLRTFYPYLIFIVFLFSAKFFLNDFRWYLHEGVRPFSFYQPGIIFILTSILYLTITNKNKIVLKFYNQSRETLFKTGKSIAAIFLLVLLAQLIQDDLSVVIKNNYAELQLTLKVFITPFVGVMGSFISGSATMSNMLVSNAIKINEIDGSNVPLLLALVHTGSAIGNAISLQNILMVKSVINQPLIGYTKIFKYNFFIIGIYSIVIILLALLII